MKIGVIGAGAAGLIAGAFAAKGGASVDIIDRNEKTGKKLFLTGKGRCNITNSALGAGPKVFHPPMSKLMWA